MAIRDIIFRGKRLDTGEWVEGGVVQGVVHELWRNSDRAYITVFPEFLSRLKLEEVDPSTVGQFTGLTANSKKIFEGDIIKYKNTDGIKFNGVALTVIGKVVYNEKNASFAISGKDEIGAKHYDYFPIKNIEVIGNIHDNPELLEE